LKTFIRRTVIRLLKAKDWTIAQLVFATLAVLNQLPAQRAIQFTDWIARRVGPLTSRHKLALNNLKLAMPEKTEQEREAIARDMWANMARLMAEYVFLDKLIDYDVELGEGGLIEVEGVELFLDLVDNPRPFIVFTAHTGNFELLPAVAAKYGLSVTALFRPPNNPYIARKLLAARRTHSGNVVPSKVGVAWKLANVLEEDGGVGLLVDQKFRKGPKATFFGREVITNPLLGKLARHVDCDVYPARCIRLPDNRFKLIIEPPVVLPRNDKGAIDPEGTAQIINDKVESWIREYPGQWMWFHDRWGSPRGMGINNRMLAQFRARNRKRPIPGRAPSTSRKRKRQYH